MTAVRDPEWRKERVDLYAQDDWRVGQRLTVVYGLRWDYAGQGHEREYRTSQVGLTTPNPSAGGLPGGFIYRRVRSGTVQLRVHEDLSLRIFSYGSERPTSSMTRPSSGPAGA